MNTRPYEERDVVLRYLAQSSTWLATTTDGEREVRIPVARVEELGLTKNALLKAHAARLFNGEEG